VQLYYVFFFSYKFTPMICLALKPERMSHQF